MLDKTNLEDGGYQGSQQNVLCIQGLPQHGPSQYKNSKQQVEGKED